VAAGEAKPQVYPAISHLETLLAASGLGLHVVNLIQMDTDFCHGVLLIDEAG
jgi:hypothetical protein